LARVVVSAPLPGRVREILAPHDVLMPARGEAPLVGEALLAALGEAEGLLPLLSVRIDDALLARAPRLRVVGNFAVGYDNVDLAACARRGIVVTNTPVLTESTADLTMALVLGAARRLREGLALASSGGWSGWEPEQLLGLELDGARLGIVGMGRIGRAVARRAEAFGMEIVWSGPHAQADAPGRQVSLDELVATSDVVAITCRLDASTRHLIGPRELAAMKPGAIVVNSARGPIVDEAALVEALDRGQLGAVGLDVFEEEPRIPERLRAHPRALVLPHLGSATTAARVRMAETAAQSIADVLAGRRPRFIVNG
jgi:glyoxylate reductase